MKLVNELFKNQSFNIAGKTIKVDENGVIDVADKSAAKVLVETAGFKLLKGKKDENLYVEPSKEEDGEDESGDLDETEDSEDADEEAKADAEAEAELEKNKEEQAKKQQHKYLPGSNNKNRNKNK